MKFLIDAQLPRALARWLETRGHDAVHTLDLPKGNRTTDHEICSIADLETRFVVTEDDDFVRSHTLSDTPSRLLLISTGNITNAALLMLFERNIDAIEVALAQSRFVEIAPHDLVIRA